MVCITILLCIPSAAFAEEYSVNDIYSLAIDIINWKKIDNGSTRDGYLINNTYLDLAGTTPGDWYQIGMSRLELEDDYAAYLAVVEQEIESRYTKKSKLSASKATEWHRISLAVLASGGNPLSIGTDANGNSINLIADGTYDRGNTVSLGKQGINGWIWGLIALDSMQYQIPDSAFYSRDDIIGEIVKKQLSDGGFALTGTVSDPDITAMAIQSLAPYYSRPNIKSVIDKALKLLSEQQLPTGDYASWGMQNVESTAQVMIALCTLGIDPLNDNRFIKEGNTLLDGILRYRMHDGGFVHSYTYDAENPTSKPTESNTMASEQVLLALAALWRFQNGKGRIYDFTDVKKVESGGFNDADKAKVDALPRDLTTEYYTEIVKLLEKLENSGDFSEKEKYRSKLIEAKQKIEAIQKKIDRINSTIRVEISADNRNNTVSQNSEANNTQKEDAVNSVISEMKSLSEYDRQKIEGLDDLQKEGTKIKTKTRAIWIYIVCAVVFCALATLVGFNIYKRITRKKREQEAFFNEYQDEE